MLKRLTEQMPALHAVAMDQNLKIKNMIKFEPDSLKVLALKATFEP
jgi:hypothetical protein